MLALSGALGLGILEGGVRLLEGKGVIRTTAETFAEGSYQAETRKSSNRVLAWELDPKSAALNSHAFRDREYEEVKPFGTRRVIVLGDSVAYGHGVPMEQGFTEVLERRLDDEVRPVEVLNFGVGGYNTRQQAEHYAVNASRFEHDLVVVAYVLNDALPAERMAALADLIDAMRADESARRPISHAVDQLRNAFARLRGLDAEDIAPYVRETHGETRTWRAVETGLGRIAERARKADARAALVLIPLLLDLDHYPFADVHGQVAAAARRKGFEVFDLASGLAGEDSLSLRLDPGDITHPNVRGHERIAELLEPELRRWLD